MRNPSRNKRVKTDYHKVMPSNSSLMAELRANTPHRSSVSSQKETILTRVLNEINQEINYASLSLDDIYNERMMLNKKLKQMNTGLAKMIEKEWHKRNEEQRISNKAIVGREMGLNYHQICRQYVQNTHKIKSMEQQFSQNNKKLILLSNPDSKLALVKKIADSQLKIKQLKQSLSRIKKNKLLRQRQLIKGTDSEHGEITSLQLDYINISKKQEYLITKSQKLQQELSDIQFSLQKQKDYYDELRDQCHQLDKSVTNPANNEHMKILYDSHKKQLDHYFKRNQRDQETKKRKYYSLLLSFQKQKKKDQDIDCKICQGEENIEKSNQIIRTLLDQLQRIKYQDEVRKKSSGALGFMLTEIPRARVALRHKNDSTIDYQRKYSEKSPKRPEVYVRKWNSRIQGSIIKQKSTVHQNITSIDESYNQNESFLSVRKSKLKKCELVGGQIRHFQTETTPIAEYQQQISMSRSQIEEIYPSDFEV